MKSRAYAVVAKRIILTACVLMLAPQSIPNAFALQAEVAAPLDPEGYRLSASYFNVRDFAAAITLNNKGPAPLQVFPTLFSLSGERADLPPLSIEGNSFTVVSFADWTDGLSSQFLEGNLQLVHYGKALELGAQIRMVDSAETLSFDEQMFAGYTQSESSRLEAVWWLPWRGSDILLAVTNTTDEAVVSSIHSTLPAGRQVQVELGPRQTRMLEVRETFLPGKSGNLPASGGFSIAHSGPPGAVLARGFVSAPDLEYSSVIEFLDPESSRSSAWHGAGLRLGAFEGEELFPVVVARNLAEDENWLRVKASFQTETGEISEAILPEKTLEPGQVMDLSRKLRQAVLRTGAVVGLRFAGFEAEYGGEPGAMLLTVMSVSESGKHAFRVPLTDPAAISASAGGFPWYVSPGSSTFVHLKNVTDAPQQYTLQVDHESGVLGLGLKTVEPGQSVSIDVSELRGDLGEQGDGWLPVEASRGQILWSVVGPNANALIAHSEQVDRMRGLSSLYSCYNCCPDSHYSSWLAPGSALIPIGQQQQLEGKQQNENCYGTLLNPFTAFGSWQTFDAGVATVNSSGLVSAVAAGSTHAQSSWDAYKWYFHGYYNTCMSIHIASQPAGPVEVEPCSISINVQSSDNFLISTTPAMPTIQGSASVEPVGTPISWNSQIVFTAPTGSGCSGGPQFDSPNITGSGTSFTPTFTGFFGGALGVSAQCASDATDSDSFPIGGTDPGKTAIQGEIGNVTAPFDSGDLKRIACQESGQRQFVSNGLPLFGGGGDTGIMQICFQRTANDLWHWRSNIARGRAILNSSLTFSMTMPQKVRTQVVRNQGPFPDATDFDSDQLRRESIKRYNAGTALNVGYWEWDDDEKMWISNPLGGGDVNFVANVLNKSPSCP